MTLYLASGKDSTADSGQWVIIVESKNKRQARVRLRLRLTLSRHTHLLRSPYSIQILPIGSSGLVYCDCTGESQ